MNTVNENVKDQRNIFKNVVQKNLHRSTPKKMKGKSVQSKEVEFKAGTDQIKAAEVIITTCTAKFQARLKDKANVRKQL